ncbi:DUF551 domain-containing protein [Enterobacter hormaechei subsp. steigerwaltii]|uniref:DUF551 domain-containing protein n=1 Tax=Enterobacter hormaechei TaxID=158836 RepID=UPI003F42303A
MTNNNLTDERLSVLIRVARDSLELYEMELPVIDDVMLALAELQQRRAAMLQSAKFVTTTYKLPAIGWLRADYQDDNRGLRGNAPLFVLGKKDPSTVWGLDYIPLTSNSPAIPDGWVACSERMPEEGDDMIVFTDEIVMSGVSYSKKKGFYLQALEYDDDEPVDNVTHWMPLPAAPKQEVRCG